MDKRRQKRKQLQQALETSSARKEAPTMKIPESSAFASPIFIDSDTSNGEDDSEDQPKIFCRNISE